MPIQIDRSIFTDYPTVARGFVPLDEATRSAAAFPEEVDPLATHAEVTLYVGKDIFWERFVPTVGATRPRQVASLDEYASVRDRLSVPPPPKKWGSEHMVWVASDQTLNGVASSPKGTQGRVRTFKSTTRPEDVFLEKPTGNEFHNALLGFGFQPYTAFNHLRTDAGYLIGRRGIFAQAITSTDLLMSSAGRQVTHNTPESKPPAGPNGRFIRTVRASRVPQHRVG